MNVTQYLLNTVNPPSRRDASWLRKYSEAKRKRTADAIRACLNKPRTTDYIETKLGYTNGGIHSIMFKLKWRKQVACIGQIKRGKKTFNLWKWIEK